MQVQYFNSHAPWGAWLKAQRECGLRSRISTHTLRGERDVVLNADDSKSVISTHTLRGERDLFRFFLQDDGDDFNSHAPWGAWRASLVKSEKDTSISTHTLRGERDVMVMTHL